MVAIQLDKVRQEQLERLASSQGRPVVELAQQVIEDYIDLQGLRELSDDEWNRGLVALAKEVFPEENWDEKAEP